MASSARGLLRGAFGRLLRAVSPLPLVTYAAASWPASAAADSVAAAGGVNGGVAAAAVGGGPAAAAAAVAAAAAASGVVVSVATHAANDPFEDRWDVRWGAPPGTSSSSSSSSSSLAASSSSSSLAAEAAPSASAASAPATADSAAASAAPGSPPAASAPWGGAPGVASGGGRVLAAVFDGHGGWQAAEFARKALLPAVEAELACAADGDDPSQIAAALGRAFERVDRAFVSALWPAFDAGFQDVARVGACALAAVVHRRGVVVANAGDCRAVLGRVRTSPPPAGSSVVGVADVLPPAAADAGSPSSSSGEGARVSGSLGIMLSRLASGRGGSVANAGAGAARPAAPAAPAAPAVAGVAGPWVAVPAPAPGVGGSGAGGGRAVWVSALALSSDHNAREPRERARLEAAHPGEADVVVCRPNNAASCYVKGRLQPTRALGDAYLKFSEFNAPPAGPGVPPRAARRHMRAPFTPPYISSAPETAAHALDDADDARSFLLLACDGVWDVLTNTEAAAFVAADAGPRESVAERLKEHVLARAAAEEGRSVDWIKSLPPGSGRNMRRGVHDDITVVVAWLGRDFTARGGGEGLAALAGSAGSAAGEGAPAAARRGWLW